MSDNRLRIERLALRVRGMDEAQAREFAQALGPDVLRHLAPALSRAGAGRVKRVDAGNVAFASLGQVSSSLATAITARLPARDRS